MMNLEKLKTIVDSDPANVIDYLMCLVEETGEISRTILEDKGIKKKKNKQTLKHEVVDAVLCSLGLYLKVAGSFDDDFVRITGEKMKKWENRLKTVNELD